MNYVNLFQKIRSSLNPSALIEEIDELTQLELGQTYSCQVRSANHALELARKAGLEAELIEFPMDGRTSYEDKIMPYAWEARVGKLTVVSSPVPFDDPVIADYQRHPFHLIKGSPALKAGGEYFRLISYDQLTAGADPDHALVLLPPESRPFKEALKTVLDSGASGVVSCFVRDRYLAPDGIGWANGCTASGRWNFSSADRNYLGFCVSPRMGDTLREVLRKGEIIVKAECDGKQFEAKLPAVTAVIPGRHPEEVWLMAHLYEPLADDNSSGVIACLEIARKIRQLIRSNFIARPEFTLRVVFTMELHGFAAFREKFRDKEVLGAVNMDGFPLCKGETGMRIYMAPPPRSGIGNALMRETIDQLAPKLTLPVQEFAYGAFQDDQALSDPLVGVPVIWPHAENARHWHNSVQTVEIIDQELLAEVISVIGCWSVAMLSGMSSDGDALGELYIGTLERLASAGFGQCVPGLAHLNNRLLDDEELPRSADSAADYAAKVNYVTRMLSAELDGLGLEDEQKKLEKHAKEMIASYIVPPQFPDPVERKWYNGSANIVITRLEAGLPYDLCKAKTWIPAIDTIYTPTGRVLGNSDGKKNFQQLLRETEYQINAALSEKNIRHIFDELSVLESLGYIRMDMPDALTTDQLKAALKDAGIGKGDCLMVQSDLGALGPRRLTAASVNNLLWETVGTEGSLFVPGRNEQSFCYERKFSSDELYSDLRHRPGAFCDRHSLYSVAGLGVFANLLHEQEPLAAPFGSRSIWAKSGQLRGKLLFIGAKPGASLFLHFLETEKNLWYLEDALIRTEGHRALIPQTPGGCPEFAESGKRFLAAAQKRGLSVTAIPLGYGELCVINAAELHRIGNEILNSDPGVLLCGKPSCLFCANAARRRPR